jgi:elongation factor P--(R)-beta-lysine ligase
MELSMNPTEAAWWPERYADRRPFLLQRAVLLQTLRDWFSTHGFVEVETPILQVSPANETHLHGFATELIEETGERRPLYLHTSPEFACKKLLAAGEEKIVTFARVFRNRERSKRHHPEFTMIEWYRANESYETLMDDCSALLRAASEATGHHSWHFNGLECDPNAEPERLSVGDAFIGHADIDLLSTLGANGEPDRAALSGLAQAKKIHVSDNDSWTDIYSKILTERIEPSLGAGRATILCDYPISEAALARRKPDDPRLAERFELYACGLELANAFGELTDPFEQRARFEADMDEKERLYGERYPIDEDFMTALAHMPPTAGIALGLDRLAMLATGASRIDDVLWLPVVG